MIERLGFIGRAWQLLASSVHGRLSPTKIGALAIISGTASGQLIGLAAVPVLARLYTPSDFGVYAVLVALSVTLGTVSALRLEMAIPLPASDSDAHALVWAGLLSAALIGMSATGLVAAGGDSFAAALDQPRLMPWLWAVPASGALMGSYLVLSQLAIRARRFTILGRRNLLQAVSMALVQLTAGAAGARSGGLVAGFGFGHLSGALSLARGAGWRSQEARAGRKRVQIRTVVSRYRRFPLVLAPAGLLNVVGLQAPVVLVAYYYGAQVAGWLGLTQRVLALPVTLLGTAVAQIYIGEFAVAARSDLTRARQLFQRATRILLPIAGMLFLLLIVFSPWAFAIVFGSAWRESGQYAQALSFGLAAQMIGSPLSQTLIVLEKHAQQLAWDALRVASTSAVVAVVAWAGAPALTAIWSVGFLSAALYALAWWLSYHSLMPRSAKHHCAEV